MSLKVSHQGVSNSGKFPKRWKNNLERNVGNIESDSIRRVESLSVGFGASIGLRETQWSSG